MPIKRSPFSGKRSYKPKPIPLVNPKPSASPTDALYASVAMLGSILEQLNKLINGPMAFAQPFFKSYVNLAAKNLSDLLKQLSHKLNGTHSLDAVAASAVDLLDTLAEHDEDTAEELAGVLSDYAEISGSNVMLEKLLTSKTILALHDPLVEIIEGEVHIAGVVEVEQEGVVAEIEFDEVIPVQALNPVLRKFR